MIIVLNASYYALEAITDYQAGSLRVDNILLASALGHCPRNVTTYSVVLR